MSKTADKSVLLFCFALLTAESFFAFAGIGEAETVARVYVDPPLVTGLTIGDSFTINVSVAEILNLTGYEFQLFYNPQLLNATKVEEGQFLKSEGGTLFLPLDINDHYNSTHGRVYVACTTLPATEVDGSGTLTAVTFQVVGFGSSALALPEDTTNLVDNTPRDPQPIPHTTADGFVSLATIDIGITKISLSKTIVNDTQVTINVTAANLGKITASFSVILYYDIMEIDARTATELAPATSLVLTFVWDTTPIPKGNYTISAYAPPITGENNTENNRLVDGWIVQTILGDVDGDGKVNILDISLVATAFNAKPEDQKWNPNADIDNNGVVNIIDITKVAKEFGKVDS